MCDRIVVSTRQRTLSKGSRLRSCATGKILWSGDLETRSQFEASPTVADDKVYVMDHKGNVFVTSAAPENFKLIGSAAMGDETDNYLRSSVAVSQGNLFIRTGKKLYCVGKK